MVRVARLLLLVVALGAAVLAQGIDGALTSRPPRATQTIFDEISDSKERAAFRLLWETREPAQQKDLGLHFVEQYPRSVLLREAYELIARAYVAAGDDASGLTWAKRSLRLMPENPFLLAMMGEVAARVGQLDLAETSARDALAYLANASTPAPLTDAQWPAARDDLRATSHFVIGRVLATRGQYAAAQPELLASLGTRPNDAQTLFVLGLTRIELKDDEGAAQALAAAVRSGGQLASRARETLRQVYQRRVPKPTVTFDEYVASLKWVPPAATAPAPLRSSGTYAGSAACKDCHATQYKNWSATGMSKMFRPYRAEDVIGDFSGRQAVSDLARAVTREGRHVIEMRKTPADPWVPYSINYIIGSKWQQAYATTLPDGRFLVFPIQYSKLKTSWLNYWSLVDAADSARANISRFDEHPEDAVYQGTCASCHTSQLKGQSFREGGINCEMCHGPSSEHVAAKKSGKVGAASATPVRFGRISASESTAICAQCHSQSSIHEPLPSGAINYSDGVSPFYRKYQVHLPSNFSRTAFYRDGRHRATTFISEAFARTQCFRKGGATCASCHNPHPSDGAENPTSLKFKSDPNQMCLQCHTALRAQPERHTRHAAGTEASQCVSCHMPKIMDALLFPARSHEIDDIPDAEMTARFGQADSPNACLICHRNRDTAWLGKALVR